MHKKFLCLLILPFVLIACGQDELQDGGLFQLKINSVEGDVGPVMRTSFLRTSFLEIPDDAPMNTRFMFFDLRLK